MNQDKSKLKVHFLGCSTDPIQILYSAFRMCYSNDDALTTWDKIINREITRKTMSEFLSEKLGTGHTSPLRQAQFVFVVDNISRAATAQFNRHHVGVERSEMSQRYVNFNRGIGAFVTPKSFQGNPKIEAKWQELQGQMVDFYTSCVESGIPAEDARFGLPMATVSREQFAMGFQAIQNFLDVRMCERAQWEIKDMAWQIYRIMKKRYPELSSNLGIKCWENRSLYCDEDYKAYQGCKWRKSRPHKVDLVEMLKAKRI